MNHTDNQKNAIETTNNNLKIIACAGSGKTMTVVDRMMNILTADTISPNNIVAITFSKKAAGELKERIFTQHEADFGHTKNLSELFVGTIHSFCLDLLLQADSKYNTYQVLDGVQQQLFVKRYFDKSVFEKIKYFNKGSATAKNLDFNSRNLSSLIQAISTIKEECLTPSDYPAYLQDALKEYERLLDEHHFLDYTYIESLSLKELKTNQNLRNYVMDTFKYITIDEFQDVNAIQYAILETLYDINPDLNICVVGDDDQTIYNWRGSSNRHIIEFEDNFSDVRIEPLTHNFRSSNGIINLAEKVVTLNDNRIDKTFYCGNTQTYEPGDIMGIQNFPSIDEESDFIVDAITKLHGSEYTKGNSTFGLNYDDMVILTYSPSKLLTFYPDLIDKLGAKGIEVIVEGTKNLFASNQVNDIIMIFQYINDLIIDRSLSIHSLSFKSLSPSSDVIQKIDNYLLSFINNALAEKAFWPDFTIQDLYQNLLTMFDVFDSSTEKALYNYAAFSNVINDFESIYLDQKFDTRIKNFVSFLGYEALDIYPEGWLSPSFQTAKCLKILSYHKSKGLEFPVVFMPFLCENYLFPTQGAGGISKWSILGYEQFNKINALWSEYQEKVESLNRLFYVGVTRCEKYLFMTKSVNYQKPGGSKNYAKPPKPFILALNSDYVKQEKEAFLDRSLAYSNNAKISNDDVLVFDFSTLKDYFECPYKFKLSSMYGFFSPLNVRMGYGKSVHSMLEEIHKNYILNGTTSYTEFEIDSLIKRQLYLPQARNLKQLYKDMTRTAKSQIINYLEVHSPDFKDIHYVEQKIDFQLNDIIFINGRVDLIKNTSTKETKIIDFKSNNNILSDDLLKKQLSIYALGYKNLTGETPDILEAYDIKNLSPKRFDVTPQLLSDISNDIHDVYKNIRSNIFNKNKSSSCDKCQFSVQCKK